MWEFEPQVQKAWAEVDTGLRDLAEPLSTQWQEDCAALEARCGNTRIADLLSHRDMFPSAPLIWWAAAAFEYPDQAVLHDLTVGAFYAYLFIRLQDDVMDGQARTNGGLLVGNICLERFHYLYRRHFAAQHPFWSLWQQLMRDYAATTLWELRRRRAKRRAYTSTDLERLGEKFIPAAAPPAAVAYLARRHKQIAPITDLVACLGRALQLVNDHTGIVHDFKTHNYTAVISDILIGVKQDRVLEERVFAEKTLTTDALSKNLRRAQLYFNRAQTVSNHLGFKHTTHYIEAHQKALKKELIRLDTVTRRALDLKRDDTAAKSNRREVIDQLQIGG